MRDDSSSSPVIEAPKRGTAGFNTERVLDVTHYTDKLFSFKTTRDPSFRFRSGQFVMIGLMGASRPLLRAYSVASAVFDDHLEFFSIKVPDGPLTSRLQRIAPGDDWCRQAEHNPGRRRGGGPAARPRHRVESDGG